MKIILGGNVGKLILKHSPGNHNLVRDVVFISSVSENHLCGCNFGYDNCDPNVVVFWMPLMAKATTKKKTTTSSTLWVSWLLPLVVPPFRKTPRFRLHLHCWNRNGSENNMSFQPFKEKSLKITSLPLILDKTIHIFLAINFFFLSRSINFYILPSPPDWGRCLKKASWQTYQACLLKLGRKLTAGTSTQKMKVWIRWWFLFQVRDV